ncbi:hypothetical protein C4D60_Mb04t16870 [Musa balbisiana]|uniref:Uncharacterized protein n=1 Tax=Musa balbisiana TaxID=52838 RepID=A0A4S8KCP7_MUSBA|nr:hypothetical protein C4D60_Mb04t16870 [Musa balbisiana]
MLPKPIEKKSGTCQSFRKSAEEIIGGSQRSPRRLGYSLISPQDRELVGSPLEEIQGRIGSSPESSPEQDLKFTG